MIVLLVRLGRLFFVDIDLQIAYRKLKNDDITLLNWKQRVIFAALVVARRLGLVDALLETFRTLYQKKEPQTFSREFVAGRLSGIYWEHPLEIDDTRPPTINVLVPGFDTAGISAGFFGVFQTAKFLKDTGFAVRFVLFDDYPFVVDLIKERMKNFPGLETIFDDIEHVWIGDRKTPLKLSPHDTALATVWYSAYLARRIQTATDPGQKFLYLIQDYESRFYPEGSQSVLAEATYRFDYAALVSTEFLRQHFLRHDIGGFASRAVPAIAYDNACSASLPERARFISLNTNKPRRTFVYYSRPMVDRNMFDLTAAVIAEAFRRGILSTAEWECIGMGMGDAAIEVAPGLYVRSLPRMNLRQYLETVSGFDVCLTLMASPHPSMIPMDLAGSGAVVVTNTFSTKSAEGLRALSDNIIAVPPDMDALVEAIRLAADRSTDLDARYTAAASMSYPRSWSETFTDDHVRFVRSVLAPLATAGRTAAPPAVSAPSA